MDFFIWCLILSGLAGGVMIVWSIINFHGAKQGGEPQTADAMLLDRKINDKINEFDSTVKDADDVYNNLDSLSKNVFKEFDAKYQEMLFLYNLIDDKKKELADVAELSALAQNVVTAEHTEPDEAAESIVGANSIRPITPHEPGTVADDESRNPLPAEIAANPRLEKVIKMKNEGLSVSQIAKSLNIGKGEVMLLLNIVNK